MSAQATAVTGDMGLAATSADETNLQTAETVALNAFIQMGSFAAGPPSSGVTAVAFADAQAVLLVAGGAGAPCQAMLLIPAPLSVPVLGAQGPVTVEATVPPSTPCITAAVAAAAPHFNDLPDWSTP